MSARKAWAPLLLTIAGFAGIGSLAVYRLLETSPFALQAIAASGFAIYLAWMSWESRVSVREIAKPEALHDRGTMELCAAVKIALLIAALAGGNTLLSGRAALIVAGLGVAAIAGGIRLRSTAIRALGESYSHRIRTPERGLVIAGPYRAIRHPAYAGTLLIHTGAVCICLNWFSLAALAAWFAAVWYRTRVEDDWLMRSVPEYSAYRSSVRGSWLPALSFQAVLPILLSIALASLICWLSALKLSAMPSSLAWALGIFIAIYLGWIVAESKLAVGEISKERTRTDFGTCEFYAFGRAATVLSALALPTRWDSLGWWYPAGLAIFLAGVTLRLTAIHTLGRFYSHRVRVTDAHRIITAGPYRTVRHPAYSGMILAHCGFVVCFFNVTSLLILLMILAPAVVLRIRVEERVLFELDGYREYAQGRARLIPLLW